MKKEFLLEKDKSKEVEKISDSLILINDDSFTDKFLQINLDDSNTAESQRCLNICVLRSKMIAKLNQSIVFVNDSLEYLTKNIM